MNCGFKPDQGVRHSPLNWGHALAVHAGALMALLLLGLPAAAQTRLKLSSVKAGTERVQLVHNGDFEFSGPAAGGRFPTPTGWSGSEAMDVAAGSNALPVNGVYVARANVQQGAPAAGYSHTVTLEPSTAYILSAYLWNMGDSANRVTTVVDLNDAPGEAQLVLGPGDSEAANGYFVYRSFNTATTGTNLAVRAFYDGFAGTGAAAAYYPLAAQWDNIAITRADSFVAPSTPGANANLRPMVRILSPANGSSTYGGGGGLTVSADAVDLDGSISKVQFFAGTNPIGETISPPWSMQWNGAVSGQYVLTAVATDSSGAITLSAPVSIEITVPPAVPRVQIQVVSNEVVVSWSAEAEGWDVEATSNLDSQMGWLTLTNSVETNGPTQMMRLALSNTSRFFRLRPQVDARTMQGKLLMGYQGWFAYPGDGSPSSRWIHWFRSQNPTAENATFDFWPDLSELDEDELYPTSLTYADGSPAKLYSAYNPKTVMRHFKWMHEYNLDGVFLQRFSSGLSDAAQFARMNRVAVNVRAGADKYQRVFAMMYDISGHPTNTLVSGLTNDWLYLVNTLQITNSSRYLHHKGKPVIAIWGFGFSGRPDTPQQAQQVINFFKTAGMTVMGGLPTYWRTRVNDAQSNPAWAPVFRSFDVISPWLVGRYGNNSEADNFRVNIIAPDLAEAKANGRDYMPVIFPGFSWHNLTGDPLNAIPRRGGAFYWRQAFNAKLAGCSMIYGAMFDEVDEGTAMYKLAPTRAQLPMQGSFVALDADGISLPSDWYLRLADQASRMLRGDIPLQSTIPIQPVP